MAAGQPDFLLAICPPFIARIAFRSLILPVPSLLYRYRQYTAMASNYAPSNLTRSRNRAVHERSWDQEFRCSDAFGPPLRGVEWFSGFEQALETCQNRGPSTRNGLDKLRVRLIHLVDERKLDGLALLFELVGQARMTLGAQLGFELISATLQDELPLRLDLEDLCRCRPRGRRGS